MAAGRSRKTGSGSSRHKTQKRKARGAFNARHIDQVFSDFGKKPEEVNDGKAGPMGSSSRVELDADVPGAGKHFCCSCSKYFVDDAALTAHQKGKPHKRRLAQLLKLQKAGMKPHTAADADTAGGLGTADHGPRLREPPAVIPMAD